MLNVSDIVNVTVNLSPLAAGRADFGVPLFIGTSDVLTAEERLRLYGSLEEIAEDFENTSPEYLAAQAYYSQSPKPKNCMIGRWVKDTGEVPPVAIYGGVITALDTIKQSGSFKLPYTAPATIATYATSKVRSKTVKTAVYSEGDPTDSTLDVTIDLSAATDFENAATLLSAALKTPDTPEVPETPEKVTYSAATCTDNIKGLSKVSCAPLQSDTQSYILLQDGTKVVAKSGGSMNQGDAAFICTQLNAKFDGYTFSIVENKCKITANSKIEDTKNIVCFVGMNLASTQDVYREVFGLGEYSVIQNWTEDNWKTIFTDTPQEVTPAVPGTPAIPGKQIATATYNAEETRFELYPAEGVTNIDFPTAPDSGTNMAEVLKLSADAGGTKPTVASESPLDAFEACRVASGGWYVGIFAVPIPDEDSLAVSSYVEAASTPTMYGQTLTDPNILKSTVTDDLPSKAKTMSFTRTVYQYSTNPYAICSLFGRIVTTNFSANNSMITLKFKQEPGISYDDLTTAQAKTLEDKRVNMFVLFNNDTAIIQQGVCSGSCFIDERFGLDWLANAVQTAVYNVLYTSATKIPQTEAGQARIYNAIVGVMEEAVYNGLLAPGTWNGDDMGPITNGTMLASGYHIYYDSVVNQEQSEREARKLPPFQCLVKLAGAVHYSDVVINVNR